eukprot:588492-Pyramimonas_sp.AAC.1
MDKSRASKGADTHPYPMRIRLPGKGARNSRLQWMWTKVLPAVMPALRGSASSSRGPLTPT